MIREHEVPQKLKEIRERVGLAMDPFARAIGYKGASGYQRYEKEEKYLSIRLVQKIEAAFCGRGTPPITRDELYDLVGIDAPLAVTPPNSGSNSHHLYNKAERTVTTILREAGITDEPTIRRITAVYYHQLASDRS